MVATFCRKSLATQGMKVVGCSHSKTSNKLQMSWQLDFNSAQSKAYRRGPISLSGHAKPFVRYLCESLTWLTYSLCNQIHFFLEPIFKNTFYKAFNLPMERVDQYRDQAAVQWTRLHNTYQRYLDIATPHTVYRWAATYVLMFLFALRIVLCEGWYIVCYTWAIYLLSMLLQFLTPKFDPSLEQEYENESIEEGTAKMSDKDEEFRPFIRRLPEFRFWLNATRGTIVALVCSLFRVFDIPVFWPILLVYFVILFTLTMRRQIQHMIKYRYLPFDIGKARYGRK